MVLLALLDLEVRLHLQLANLLVLLSLELLLKLSELLVRLLLSFFSQLLFFGGLFLLPLLLFPLDVSLVLLKDFLFSQLEITLYFLYRLFEFLFKKHSLLFDFLFGLCTDQWIL